MDDTQSNLHSSKRGSALSLQIVSACVVLLTSGCEQTYESGGKEKTVDSATSANITEAESLNFALSAISDQKANSTSRQAALHGLRYVSNSEYEKGSRLLNAAVKLDPTNSYLQLFNAYAYDQMGRSGNTDRYSLAEQGYKLSAQFDASNWISRYFLGMMYLEQRNYHAAQEQFAEVLLTVGDDKEILFIMVAASYYARDPVTAAACLSKLRSLAPNDPNVLRLSALVSAAMNQRTVAQQWLARYQATDPQSSELKATELRIDQWEMAFRTPPSGKLSRSMDNVTTAQGSPWASGGADPYGYSGDPSNGSLDPYGAQQSYTGGEVTPAETIDPSRMVLVDVVILRMEDAVSTRQGVNLMTALQLQFGAGGLPAWSRTNSSSKERSSFDDTTNSSSSVTRAISIPALSYSLNIVNSDSSQTEILARPTLAALEGVESEFFSGSRLSAAVVADTGNGTAGIQIDQEFGVKLSVLPTFLKDGKIRLAVNAERKFVSPPSEDISYTYKLETTETAVNANVVMEFGETLILGGLSERETTNNRNGVPVLQDIPGLQYLFSKRTTSDFQRSVLLLITPQVPQSSLSQTKTSSESGTVHSSDVVEELRARYNEWLEPYPNLASVISHMNNSSLAREFRTGDVQLGESLQHGTRSTRLLQALDFLFY